MPLYVYVNKSGERVERVFSMATVPATVRVQGVTYRRSIGAEHSPHPLGRAQGSGWPMYSDALAVHPQHIAAMEAWNREHGVPTEYTKTGPIENQGRAVLVSREHRKRMLKLHGLHDNDGGYGD